VANRAASSAGSRAIAALAAALATDEARRAAASAALALDPAELAARFATALRSRLDAPAPSMVARAVDPVLASA